MCRFKSGIILEDRVVLAPAYNDSHSTMLEKLGINDNRDNASRLFVRVELVPFNGRINSNVDDWNYIVDQDTLPKWYVEDAEEYEFRFRDAVAEWMQKNTIIMAGRSWSSFKTDEKGTYYLLNDILFRSEFGNNNNYAESIITKELAEHRLTAALKDELGDRLVNISLDLLSMDGLRDYGTYQGGVLEIPTFDLYRECREKIINLGESFFTATPDSTPSGYSTSCVRYVDGSGVVGCRGCGWNDGVRPFCILKS